MTCIQPCIRPLLLALIVVCSIVPSVTAQEYTTTLTFYQGLNLEQDEVMNTPEVISVVFCGAATEPFVPALDRALYAFRLKLICFWPIIRSRIRPCGWLRATARRSCCCRRFPSILVN